MKRNLILAGGLALVFAMASTASAQLSWVDNIAGTWIDTTANPLGLSDDGEVDINTTVGNAVFGAGTVRVGSNGAARFAGSGQSLGFSNGSIPSSNLFGGDQSLAPFWDDINTNSGQNGDIHWAEIGDTLVISWDGVDFFGGGTDVVSFQLQVHGSGPGLAQLLYGPGIDGARADGGGSATIGYQAGGIENDAQFSFNTPGAVAPGTVLTLVPEPATLVLLGLGGLALIRRR